MSEKEKKQWKEDPYKVLIRQRLFNNSKDCIHNFDRNGNYFSKAKWNFKHKNKKLNK